MNSIDADFGKSIKGCGEKFSLDALDARQQDGTGLVREGGEILTFHNDPASVPRTSP